MNLKRLIKWLAISVISIPVIFYLIFVGLLEITERQWLGKAPKHPSTNVRLLETHQLALLDVGMNSLATRLQMIEQAKHSIDLEFFIYELDTTSRLISNALVRRAREGIKVRVIVDFARPVFKLRPTFARKLQSAGIQVRYYNTAGLLRFFAVQHRTHRKMLIVDNEMAIIGGRNIGDDYFDLSQHYNFLDSDIWIEGKIVQSIAESFNMYWTSEWTDQPLYTKGEISDEELFRLAGGKNKALAWLREEDVDDPLNQALLNRRTLQKIHECSDVQFITDHPGSGVERRLVYRAINELAREAKQTIRIETPYFILRKDGLEDLRRLGQRGIRLDVLTNSLYSTDAYYTVAALLPLLNDLKKLPGMNLYAYKGRELVQQNGSPELSGKTSIRWGVHAKRAIIDNRVVVVGTYNIDPRSANLNSELVLICRGNTDLADDAIQSFELRRNASRLITGSSTDASGRKGLLADVKKKKVWITYGIMPFACLFDFLL